MIGSITPYLTLLAALVAPSILLPISGHGKRLALAHIPPVWIDSASVDFVSVGPSFHLRIDRSIA